MYRFLYAKILLYFSLYPLVSLCIGVVIFGTVHVSFVVCYGVMTFCTVSFRFLVYWCYDILHCIVSFSYVLVL